MHFPTAQQCIGTFKERRWMREEDCKLTIRSMIMTEQGQFDWERPIGRWSQTDWPILLREDVRSYAREDGEDTNYPTQRFFPLADIAVQALLSKPQPSNEEEVDEPDWDRSLTIGLLRESRRRPSPWKTKKEFLKSSRLIWNDVRYSFYSFN